MCDDMSIDKCRCCYFVFSRKKYNDTMNAFITQLGPKDAYGLEFYF